MKVKFILEVYAYRRKSQKPTKLHGPFLSAGFTFLQVLCHYWAVEYKFKFYRVMKRCFILLSHFVVVKDFQLF